MAATGPRRIAFVAFEGVEVLDVTGPWEVFNTAGLIAVTLGAAVVFFLFPRKEREQALLAEYAAESEGAPA